MLYGKHYTFGETMITFLKFHSIKKKLKQLSEAEICLPIEIFSLSRELAELYPNSKVQRIYDDFVGNHNAFVRRAMVTTVRFVGGEFARSNVESVRSLLKDGNDWVSYDAIWALSKHSLINEADKKLIQDFATPYKELNMEELRDISPETANDYRNKKAAEVLRMSSGA